MKSNVSVQVNYTMTGNGIENRGRYKVRIKDTRPYHYSDNSGLRYRYVLQPAERDRAS